MSSSPVVCTGLGRRFGTKWALAHVDLEIQPASVTLLAGANGSGKTTLLRIIAGLVRPTLGTVAVFGEDPRIATSYCRQRLSLVSHRGFLYPGLTALETLRLWSALLSHGRNEIDLLGLLDSVGLADDADSDTSRFSAGMRKRLTLLRVQLERPELVLLDEPFAALDPAGQTLIESWTRELAGRGTTVIMASHAINRARALCESAILLEQGQIVWSGDAARMPTPGTALEVE